MGDPVRPPPRTRAPAVDRLPAGFRVALSQRTRRCDDGRSLVGGTGGSVLYLSARAAELVAAPSIRVPPAVPGAAATGPARTGPAAELARLLLDRGFADPCWVAPAGPDGEVADVSVVVPVRDDPDRLAALLAALPAGVPVVVVDDGSADPGACARVAERYAARLVAHAVNRGPAAARNTGLRAVATSLVAFCDADVVPEPGWLATLRRHLDDPALALAAPRVLGARPGPGDGWIERYEQARSSLDLGPRPAAVRVGGPVSYLPSACLLARVEALGDGFDESLRAGEDVDLVWRLLAAGWRVRYEPAAVVRHGHRVRPGTWWRRKAFYGTSAAPLAARHPGAVAPVVLAPWSSVLALALLAQRRWSLPVAAASAVVATAGVARRLGRSERPVRAAAVLVAEGAVASAWQTASALTRHYWPVAALLALRSRRARRALLVAGVLEALADHRRTRPDLGIAAYALLHRLDDLGYGAGLWWGVLRAGSPRALLPRLRGWPRPPRLRRR